MHAAILARAHVEDVADTLATAEAVGKRLESTIALLDPGAIYNARHVESAVFHAERAWREGRATAKTLAAEILLYAAAEHQVSRAIERVGIRVGLDRVIVVAVGAKAAAAVWGLLDKTGWSRDSTGLPVNPAALGRLGLPGGVDGEAELAVLERVALVDVRK